MTPHRIKRILRRHLSLMVFLQRVPIAALLWINWTDESRQQMKNDAFELWYT